MAGGRPPKYLEEYCEKLIKAMADGYSLTYFAAEIDCHKDTLYEWMKKHRKFSDAYKKGKEKQARWWEVAGRSIALGGKNEKGFDSKRANATIFVWMTKNMLGWRDKIEHEGNLNLRSSDGSMTPPTPQVIISLPDNGRTPK